MTSTAVDAALVTALADVKATDNISFTANNTALADNSDVRALISLSKTLPKANFSAITSVTTSEVSLAKQAIAIIKNNTNLAVDLSAIEISASDANAIAKATSGVLTATIKDGGVAATLKAIGDVKATDAITFTTTDKTVKASDLVDLNAKLAGGTFTTTSINTITGGAKDVASIAAAALIVSTADITVSGTITAADVATIKAAGGSGVLTANVQAAEADQLNSSLTTGTSGDELNLVVNGQTALATDLNSLIAKTAGKIKLEATNVTGNLAEVQALYITNKAHFTNLGNENVTIHTDTPNATQLSTIAAATTGKVTATLLPATTIDAATVTALKDVKTSDNITFVAAAGSLTDKADMNALLAIKKIIPNADFSNIKNITAAGENDVALVKNVLKLIDPTSAVTFTGTISAKDANDIAKTIDGALNATIKSGSASGTLKALGNVDTADVITFETTDKTASAKDLLALSLIVDTFTTPNLATVTGDAKDAASGDIAAALVVAPVAAKNPEVKISGNVEVSDIKAIIDATTGKVTATLAAATATDLVAELTDATLTTGGNAINVTVNDTIADALHLSKTNGISGLTSGKIKVDSLEVAGTFAQLNEVYITNKSQFTNLGNEKVEITGSESALNVDAIAKATSGILTASVTNAAANVLVSQLKNANAKDALTITVIDPTVGDTSAKDLLTLDGKTSVALVVNTLTSISGTAADVKKVYESAGIGAFSTTETVTLSGTVKAADANAIAKLAGGAVSANVAADTAAKLLVALDDAVATDKLNLTVNGSTAKAADLTALKAKTATATNPIKVDAKEITGTSTELSTAGFTNGFTGISTKNLKVTNSDGTAAEINTILGLTTSIVTATVAGTAAILNSTLTNATNGKDALTLVINPAANIAASDLLGLDAKTSVKVDATNSGISVAGLAAQLKELVAAKGVQLAKNVAIAVSDVAVAASDLGAILKATTGIVTANVTPSTASALNSALKDANSSDALILKVSGSTATAKDLISLDGKTYVKIGLTVGEITGNIAEITNVFITNAAGFDATLGASNANISGTVDAAAADKIADATTGVVTATIKADTAAVLNAALTDATTNAYKLTVTGTSAKAADLNSLDTKTSVAVDASAIKNIDGTIAAGAVEVNKVVIAANAGEISGLGNETVNLTGATDANATLVKAINDFTTGLITLPTITFDNGAATTFNLNAATLGDLSGITGLANINASNGAGDIIGIKLADLLAANDSTSNIAFNITGEVSDKVTITLDSLAGWSTTNNNGDQTIVYTHTGGQTVTITTNAITDTVLVG